MIVDPGLLDKKIQIVEIEPVQDKYGFTEGTERVVRSCYAKVSNSTGTELVKANAEFNTLKVRFLVRYSKKKITEKMYVKFAGELYDIQYINDYDYGHEYVEIWGVKQCPLN